MVIAALAGDAGKTLVSLGLVRAWHNRGQKVAPYKKGPDYIDAAWLGSAAQCPAYNLDSFMMSEQAILGSLQRAEKKAAITVIEGNRGLFDGLDAQGSHSTAQLAKLTKTPLVLVVNAAKSTRTIAALALGCKSMDPELDIAGVIINNLATRRQEEIIRTSLRDATGLEVVGCIPKLTDQRLWSRHLGLLTHSEHPTSVEVLERLAGIAERYLDLSQILKVAQAAPALSGMNTHMQDEPTQRDSAHADTSGLKRVRIAVLKDPAFSFYYPENLEQLGKQGAELVYTSPLSDKGFPDVHAVYAGGGFPEVYAAALSANRTYRTDLSDRIRQGLPVWAECGGLMYLSKSLVDAGVVFPMVGALGVVCEQTPKPKGHGYVKLRVDGENPFFPAGTEVKGHEFHYSFIRDGLEKADTAFLVERGVGLGNGRDGIVAGNVLATYTHVHALGLPEWSRALVDAAEGRGCLEQFVKAASGSAFGKRRSVPRATGLTEHRLERLRSSMAQSADLIAKSERVRFPYTGPKLIAPDEEGGPRNLRERIERLVEKNDVDGLRGLVARQARAVRYLVGFSYQRDDDKRKTAVEAIALAGGYHPDLVKNIIRRLVWAMNDESGTNAQTAPQVLRAVSEKHPELLLPMVPDLVRLCDDDNLRPGLLSTLKNIQDSFPGRVDDQVGNVLNHDVPKGVSREAGDQI